MCGTMDVTFKTINKNFNMMNKINIEHNSCKNTKIKETVKMYDNQEKKKL